MSVSPFLYGHRGWILLVAAIPAFSGTPVDRYDQFIVPGITWGWTMYWIGVNALVRYLYGARIYGRFLAVTTLVTLPVVVTGSVISFFQALVAKDLAARQPEYSMHYIRLGLNMLTVLPLSLGLAAALPVHKIEGKLLARTDGVTQWEKGMLMALRVFNHIVFGVIPHILEVIREERMLAPGFRRGLVPGPPFSDRLRFYIKSIIHVGVEGISAATQYIPLWAMEIARLPQRKKLSKARFDLGK